jgi:hypothetical protein
MKRKRLVPFILRSVFVFLVLSLTSCGTNKVLIQEREKQIRQPQPFTSVDIEEAKKLNLELDEMRYFLSKPLIISRNDDKKEGIVENGVLIIRGKITNVNRTIGTDVEGFLEKCADDYSSFDISFPIKGHDIDAKYIVTFRKNGENNRFFVFSVQDAKDPSLKFDDTLWRENYLYAMVDWEYEVR